MVTPLARWRRGWIACRRDETKLRIQGKTACAMKSGSLGSEPLLFNVMSKALRQATAAAKEARSTEAEQCEACRLGHNRHNFAVAEDARGTRNLRYPGIGIEDDFGELRAGQAGRV